MVLPPSRESALSCDHCFLVFHCSECFPRILMSRLNICASAVERGLYLQIYTSASIPILSYCHFLQLPRLSSQITPCADKSSPISFDLPAPLLPSNRRSPPTDIYHQIDLTNDKSNARPKFLYRVRSCLWRVAFANRLQPPCRRREREVGPPIRDTYPLFLP